MNGGLNGGSAVHLAPGLTDAGTVHYFSMITDPHGHMPSPAHSGPAHTDHAAVHYSMWNSGGLEVCSA